MNTVSPTGKPIFIRRTAINEIADAVNRVNARKINVKSDVKYFQGDPARVMIYNQTAEDLRQWDSLALYYPMVEPANDRPEFTDRLTFVCDVPTGPNDPIAVATEPIPAGKMGWGVVSGLTPVYLMRDDGNTDRFCAPQDGEGILLAGKSGYPIAWEETIPDGTERIALILLGGGKNSDVQLKRRRVVAVGNDTLTVNDWVDGAWGTAVHTVCKPYLLRTSITARGGQTFVYSNGFTRMATMGAATENQVIVPSYIAGDEIYTEKAESTGIFSGGEEILDVDANGSARAWAKV